MGCLIMNVKLEDVKADYARKDAEIAKLKAENAKLRVENDRYIKEITGISNACIDALAMDYPLNPEVIGHGIFMATGLTNPELNEHTNQVEKGQWKL